MWTWNHFKDSLFSDTLLKLKNFMIFPNIFEKLHTNTREDRKYLDQNCTSWSKQKNAKHLRTGNTVTNWTAILQQKLRNPRSARRMQSMAIRCALCLECGSRWQFAGVAWEVWCLWYMRLILEVKPCFQLTTWW